MTMRAAAVLFWCALALVVAGSVVFRAHGELRQRAVPERISPALYRIDLSTAPVEELAVLPRIGAALAARIVADRARFGPFTTLDDLARVSGIGERTVEDLREVARVSTP